MPASDYAAFGDDAAPRQTRGTIFMIMSCLLNVLLLVGIVVLSREDSGALAAPLAQRSAAPLYAMPGVAGMRNTDILTVDANRGKAKTRKAAAKRYKVTSTGKVFTKMAGKQHLNTKMSRKQQLALGKKRRVEAADIPNVQGCLPFVKVK
uniref:50S ribosomal protein L35 n=1 Tax=Lotharella oceanica TaxID=641309 RepID=A0A7S2TIV8_9EUKA|mmetsp:Transcript_16201/g.30746  ORF Transcript_16201/g.30746 Transcript_16201/m.30746 type:complete len:150 (+) Transcript_16201:52-501(+)